MLNSFEAFRVLRDHGVRFVIVGGHAVNFHGFVRTTEDADAIWFRDGESEPRLLAALTAMDASYLGREIDPATKSEILHPVTRAYIRAEHLMMLWTKFGFLDLFDYIPGHSTEQVQSVFDNAVEQDGLWYVSREWLIKMKRAAGRTEDLKDLRNLGEPTP